ncbi:MAG: type IV pilus assembly protein PilM [Phycisphaerae bacterium]|nr:type IV pilus assembly protein PilM [Phycisphaerae bacterium]
MATPQTAWGIDLGRAALKAVKLRLGTDGAVEVVAADLIEHAQILTQPDADRTELISSALEKFLSRNDISKDRVVVSVAGQNTLARFTKLPPVAPKRIPDIVRYEADQQIPFDMDEVIWDYQTFQAEGLPDIEVGIFAMKRELLREHLLYFEQAAIEPVAVQTTPLAVYNTGFYSELISEQTTILLDVGAENTDLVIATRNGLWTRTIAIGGNRFTEALVKAFKLSFGKAEALKRSADTSKYRRQIFQAMRPVFSDLVQELQRSIGFYSSTHRDAEIDRVIGLGAGFQLSGLNKYITQNLGIETEVPKSFAKLSVPAPIPAMEFQPAFAAAIGLALQGIDQARVTSNLLPVEIAKQIVWRKKKPTFAAAAACLVLAGGIVWFRQTSDMRALASGAREAEQVRVAGVDDAVNVINNGPPPSLGDRAKAAEVNQAGDILRKELSDLRGQGVSERSTTETLVQLQENKVLIPRIMEVVHQSLPQPDPVLASADTGPELAEKIKEGGPPRSQRRIVRIQSMDIQYTSDIHLLIWPNLVEAPPPLLPQEEIKPGMWLRITCRTPNAGGAAFINENFIKPLRENGRKPGQGFYFDRINLVDGRKLEAELEAPASPFGRPGSRGVDETLKYDPVTNELWTDDWEFSINADVVLSDIPEEFLEVAESPEGEPGSEGTEGG